MALMTQDEVPGNTEQTYFNNFLQFIIFVEFDRKNDAVIMLTI